MFHFPKSSRKIFDKFIERCSTDECRFTKTLEYINEYCIHRKKRALTPFDRDRRGTFDQLSSDDLFLPVRGRRDATGQGPTHVLPEKKAKLDVITNDLFVPNRGRRQLVRKNFLRLEPYPLIAFEKRNNIELDNMKDFFVPHRGKRQPTINDILSDNFLPQRGKKAIDEILSDNFFPQRGKKSAAETSIIIPKSYVPMDSQWTQNINPYDRRMIDRRLHDLNLLLLNAAEVRAHNCFREKNDMIHMHPKHFSLLNFYEELKIIAAQVEYL